MELLSAKGATPIRSDYSKKLEKGFASLEAQIAILTQQNRQLFAENRICKRSTSSKSRRLVSTEGRLLTKEDALLQRMMADNKTKDQVRKARHRLAKREYHAYLRRKHPNRKTLVSNKFIILKASLPYQTDELDDFFQSSDEDDSDSETSDSDGE